jgi:hypothetical protein
LKKFGYATVLFGALYTFSVVVLRTQPWREPVDSLMDGILFFLGLTVMAVWGYVTPLIFIHFSVRVRTILPGVIASISISLYNSMLIFYLPGQGHDFAMFGYYLIALPALGLTVHGISVLAVRWIMGGKDRLSGAL